jgi:hypothetical protein
VPVDLPPAAAAALRGHVHHCEYIRDSRILRHTPSRHKQRSPLVRVKSGKLWSTIASSVVLTDGARIRYSEHE